MIANIRQPKVLTNAAKQSIPETKPINIASNSNKKILALYGPLESNSMYGEKTRTLAKYIINNPLIEVRIINIPIAGEKNKCKCAEQYSKYTTNSLKDSEVAEWAIITSPPHHEYMNAIKGTRARRKIWLITSETEEAIEVEGEETEDLKIRKRKHICDKIQMFLENKDIEVFVASKKNKELFKKIEPKFLSIPVPTTLRGPQELSTRKRMRLVVVEDEYVKNINLDAIKEAFLLATKEKLNWELLIIATEKEFRKSKWEDERIVCLSAGEVS